MKYKIFPGMFNGNTCIYIKYEDGYEEIFEYDHLDFNLDKKIKEKVNRYITKIRKKKLNKLNEL